MTCSVILRTQTSQSEMSHYQEGFPPLILEIYDLWMYNEDDNHKFIHSFS